MMKPAELANIARVDREADLESRLASRTACPTLSDFSPLRVYYCIVRVFAGFIFLAGLSWGQICVPVAALRPVDSVSGSLSDADCRLSDGSIFAEYVLTLPTFGQLQLNAASPDFPVTLFLRDSAGRKLAGAAVIQQTAERGEYTVVVNATRPGQSGKFTLTSTFQPEPNVMCRDTTRIGPNQTIAGHLVDSSCRQLNNAPYDGYLVTIFGSGTLDISLDSANFSGVVTLRGDDGRALDSDARSISVPVLGDTDYNIIVAGADPASRGDYSLSVKFSSADDETCRPQKTLNISEDIKGSIADNSCRLGSDLLFAYYNLTVVDPGFADMRVLPSGDVPMFVAILDRSGRLLSQDVESGGQGKPILRQQLSQGSYTVLVIADKRGGDYTLQYRFNTGPPSICPALELRPGTEQSGSLAAAASCHSVDSLQDVYSFSTTVAGTVDITLSSNDFLGSLALRDAKDNNLARSDAPDNQDAHIVADLAAGAYSLSALSIDSGGYTINYKFTPHELSACAGAQKLALNSALVATLGGGACRGADGQPMDTYEFTTSSPGMVAIFMTSTDVDSYVTLTDSQGSMLRRDDDSYGAPDSMILQWLPAGTYRVNASASGGSQTGRYRVDVLFVEGDRPAGCLPLADLSPGTTQGALYITSCQYADATFADLYRLKVMEPITLSITPASNAFDPTLRLLDEQGNVLDENALLVTSLEAGTYYVLVKATADQGYAVGTYRLAVE
jgi:hypothetical protein